MNEYEYKTTWTPTEQEKIEILLKALAKNLLILLNDNESFDDCDDNQCDNETCVLIKSLKKYLKNN